MNETSSSYSQRCINLCYWILLFQVVILVVLFFKFQLSRRIESEVVRVEAKTLLTQDFLLDFIHKTVERWEALQEKNPNLIVPPVQPPELKDKMEVKPTPSPLPVD